MSWLDRRSVSPTTNSSPLDIRVSQRYLRFTSSRDAVADPLICSRPADMAEIEINASQWRLVEVGRVVLFTHGPYAGRLAAIVEIIDHKRVRNMSYYSSTRRALTHPIGPSRWTLKERKRICSPSFSLSAQPHRHSYRHTKAAPSRRTRRSCQGVGECRGAEEVGRECLG